MKHKAKKSFSSTVKSIRGNKKLKAATMNVVGALISGGKVKLRAKPNLTRKVRPKTSSAPTNMAGLERSVSKAVKKRKLLPANLANKRTMSRLKKQEASGIISPRERQRELHKTLFKNTPKRKR